MKYLAFLIVLVALFFSQQVFADRADPALPVRPAGGPADRLEIQFFYGKGCPHCTAEKKFLDQIEEKYPQIKVISYLAADSKNHELLQNLLKNHDSEKYFGAVPLTFVGDDFIPGFDKSKIEISIRKQIEGSKPPKIDTNKYSLPVLAIIMGTLDGFNICSLGALILILGIVLALRSRKKILIFGGLFILTTAIIYGLLIVLWYKLFSFFSLYENVMRILVGVLGIGGGIYFLKEFIKFKKYGPTCETGAKNGIITKFSSKIQSVSKKQKSKNIFAIVAIILLFAAVITIVEFPCSAAVPVVFAGILAEAQLPSLLYLFYISLFILFYMLDEILIFLIALFTLKLWLASPKFVTWITLAEAIILFLLGFYYLIGF